MTRTALLLLLSASAAAGADWAGAGACASRTCHGGAAPSRGAGRRGDEYTVWSRLDPHRRAYRALTGARGVAIARRLGLAGPGDAAWATRAPGRERCLGCHALVPEGGRGTPAEDDWRADGVGCEACHGPAGGWLQTHTRAARADSLRAGMVETMAPERAAETCVRCHVGTAERRVDHEVLAAGHPPLVFELDYFARNLPRHWTWNDGNAAWRGGRALVAGDAAILRAAAALEPRPAAGWPDFASFDCGACHHDYGHLGREPGRDANGVVAGFPPLDPGPRPVLARLEGRQDAPAMLRALLEPPALAGLGRGTALHAYWAADDLVTAEAEAAGRPVPAGVRAVLARLEADVGARRWDAARFARDLSALRSLRR
jgi:hypothetical protein